MIELYSGTPGSGKSFHATSRAYYWSRRKWVIANYALDPKKLKKNAKFVHWDNADITPAHLIKFAHDNFRPYRESECLLIIDEAGIKLNCRDWQARDRMQWLDFFSQHRKYGYDVILIAQADIMLDKQIRQFIEIEHNHRAMKSCGMVGRIMSIAISFADVKFWYGNKMRLGVEWIRYSRKIAHLYDTFGGFKWNDLPQLQTPSVLDQDERRKLLQRQPERLQRVPAK